MREIERFKEEILKDYPRMTLDSEFTFACHPGVPCFNDCCADINIFLTPYDIIRLKNHLEITSGEFLKKYTIMPFDKNLSYPVVMLQMSDNEKKTCQLLGEHGCTVYENRPWACRMYPLGLASPQEGEKGNEDFYFLLKDKICRGHNQGKKWTVRQWIEDQGIAEYDALGREFKDITLNPFFQDQSKISSQKIDMFFMVCYDIDKFRAFVFGSTFLKKFEVDEGTIEAMRGEDVALLKFGFRWLRFSLFGEDTMKIKEDIAEDKLKELKMKGKI